MCHRSSGLLSATTSQAADTACSRVPSWPPAAAPRICPARLRPTCCHQYRLPCTLSSRFPGAQRSDVATVCLSSHIGQASSGRGRSPADQVTFPPGAPWAFPSLTVTPRSPPLSPELPKGHTPNSPKTASVTRPWTTSPFRVVPSLQSCDSGWEPQGTGDIHARSTCFQVHGDYGVTVSR